jgi:dihydroorotate dehydrogenase electron transfer subunit
MNKKVVEALIVCQEEIAPHIYRMVLQSEEVAKSAKVGMFINVYPKQKHLLLPRPISICEIGSSTVTLVYGIVGEGTKEFASYQKGDTLRISTAQGTGYTPTKAKTSILVGGGIGVPPLLELAKQLEGEKIAVLGFREDPFLIEDFKKAGATVYIATDTGKHGFKGNVLELIKEQGIQGDYYYSCGPKVMLKALANYCNEQNIPIQVSLEERMGCGYGACVGCVCKTKTDEGVASKKVCKDGPVFLGSEVAWDE